MICPVDGCDVELRDSSILMCRKHWFSVPKELRAEVWSAWRERVYQLEDPEGSGVGYDIAKGRHEHAKAAAIKAVNEKLG